jgi:hypothetical protein
MIPDKRIYEQDTTVIVNDLLPVKKRLPIHKSWLNSLLSAVQWGHDLIFNDYADGSLAPNWVYGNTYVFLDRVIYVDGAVYELFNVNGITSALAPNIDSDNWIKILDSFIGVRERARYTSQKLSLEYMLNRWYQVPNFSLIEWEVLYIFSVPVAQTSPPYAQIYIVQTPIAANNFWLTNSSTAPLTSYITNSSSNAVNFVANANASLLTSQFTIFVPTALMATILSNQLPGVTSDMAIRSIVDKYVAAGSSYTITPY